MLTEERLAELERAAATGLDERRAGHRDMVLSVRADELLALCWAARWAALLARRCRALESKLNSTVGQARQGHPDGELIMHRLERRRMNKTHVWVLMCGIEDANCPQALGVFETREECERAAMRLIGVALDWEPDEDYEGHWIGVQSRHSMLHWAMEECVLGETKESDEYLAELIVRDQKARLWRS